ncbi:MAG: nucleotidyl transferase AbiEii/AbiGii toxin family protein [Nitrospirota bacterium]
MHKECLPLKGWAVLGSLKETVSDYQAVLAGGTALALHIGHRVSVDLNFFTEKDVKVDPLIKKIKTAGMVFQVTSEGEGYLVAEIDGVKFSLIHYEYPFTAPVLYKGILIASILDIAGMKAVALSQRGTKRDFVDMYFVLQGIPFHKIAEHMVKRFGKERTNPVHIGKSFTYFADAESNYDPEYIGKKVSWEAVKTFFRKHAKQFTLDLDVAVTNGPAN